MKDSSLIKLIQLTEINGLGPTRIRSLVQTLGSPEAVFSASASDLTQVEGINFSLAGAIREYSPTRFADDQLAKAEETGVYIVTFWDEQFPRLLKRIYDPPVLLFVKGKLKEEDADTVAIVGTRTPTAYGKQIADELSRDLAAAGMTIVSGFAKGIDIIAHLAALETDGRTLAVLGNGLDVVYPAENRRYLPFFKGGGVFVSEFPLGTKPDAPNFPQRNRIISGLCHGVIVVEAGIRSGAVLTALDAVDQNRDVFAVPGRLTDPKSSGCLRLIRNGAIPVENSEQILTILNPHLKIPRSPVQQEIRLDLEGDEAIVYEILSHEPKHIDDISVESGLDSSLLLTSLLSLELKGAVLQLAGKMFVLRH
ncbi:MAG: DNA-processing protein DprA [Fidelibacterota bacterium]